MEGIGNIGLSTRFLDDTKPLVGEKPFGLTDFLYLAKNHKQILNEQQTQQALSKIADIKVGQLLPVLQRKTNDEIQQFLKEETGRYDPGTLRMNGENQGKSTLAKMQLQERINWREHFTKSYDSGLQMLRAGLVNGTADVNDVQQYIKRMDESALGEGNLGDLTDGVTVATQLLSAKPPKPEPGIYKTPEEWAAKILVPQTGELEKDYDSPKTENEILRQMQSGEYQQKTRPLLVQTGVVKDGMSPTEELKAASDYVKSKFNPAENRRGGNTIIRNGYNVPIKPVEYVENDDNSKSWIFYDEPINYSKSPVKGAMLVGVHKKPDGTFWGELSTPKLSDDEAQKMSLFATSTVDKFGNDVYEVQLDAGDYSAIKRKGLDLVKGKEEGFESVVNQRSRTGKSKTPETPKDKTKNPEVTGDNKAKKYVYNGTPYSYDELVGAGVNVKAAIDSGAIKIK